MMAAAMVARRSPVGFLRWAVDAQLCPTFMMRRLLRFGGRLSPRSRAAAQRPEAPRSL